MKIFLSGWQATNYEHESKLIKAGVIQHRCVSFAYVRKMEGFPYYCKGSVESYKACLEHKVGIMMDSGVFSYRALKRSLLARSKSIQGLPTEDTFMQLYVKYCKRYSHLWDFYVTVDLDLVAENNYQRHVQLEKMGIRPVPVIHGDASVADYIKRYVDRGYPFIGVGTSPLLRTSITQKKRFLDAVFNIGAKLGATFHGLAFTAAWIMIDYPWASVDSSSWSRAAACGSIIRFNPETRRLTTVHVSDQASSVQIDNSATLKSIRRHIEAEGFDWKELQTSYVVRHLYNAGTMKSLVAFTERSKPSGWRDLF